jgi:hypothetical protein
MWKHALALALFVSVAAPVAAQGHKAEVGVVFGYVFSDGVSGNNILVPGVGTFNRVDPKDSFGWGIDIGFFVTPNAEVGFQYTMQPTTIQVSGSTTVDIGDTSARTYHATFTYNFGDSSAPMRPYVFGGLGATSYGQIPYQTINRSGTLNGFSQFSTTWGAGVKFYGHGPVGGRVGFRWTPAYVKSDATGYWCDPYWGCYLVGNAQYANQFDINGGVTFRF